MKEIAQKLLQLRISTTVHCIDKQSGKTFPLRIDSEANLYYFDNYDVGSEIHQAPKYDNDPGYFGSRH